MYLGQNYKVNRKIKEAVDKNQVNYRESENDHISIIKRVYVYITDKKGNILPEVTVIIDGTEVKTGYNGLLISNFPNAEKTIRVEKEGYKPATANIILNAEYQTHEFFLALETDNDESEVVSTDNTGSNDSNLDGDYGNFTACKLLFEPPLDGTDGITKWNEATNKTEDGIYYGHGSYLTEGWTNERYWQLDFDVAYGGTPERLGYAGLMPVCSEEIKPFTDSKRKDYCLSNWEGQAMLGGLDTYIVEGPAQYKYSNITEYHHGTLRKIGDTKFEYYFDNNKWVFIAPNIKNLTTLHYGTRDNPNWRNAGYTILTKNIKVVKLCPKTDMNNVELSDNYTFTFYEDANGNTELGKGTITIEEIDSPYVKIKVLSSTDESLIGQSFYVDETIDIDNIIYSLYSDKEETSANMYISISQDLFIRVIDEEGNPIEGASLHMAEHNVDEDPENVYTDENGYIWWSNIPEYYKNHVPQALFGIAKEGYTFDNNHFIEQLYLNIPKNISMIVVGETVTEQGQGPSDPTSGNTPISNPE